MQFTEKLWLSKEEQWQSSAKKSKGDAMSSNSRRSNGYAGR
jgi:hypothetical protein